MAVLQPEHGPINPLREQAGVNSREVVSLLIMMYVAALSVASFVVIMQGASDEPYYRFRPTDCLTQVGVGVTLLALWMQLALGIAAGIIWFRLSRWFLAILLWGVLVCFYLYSCPSGYLGDMVTYGWKFR